MESTKLTHEEFDRMVREALDWKPPAANPVNSRDILNKIIQSKGDIKK